jgi:FkbM family methyltransferase
VRIILIQNYRIDLMDIKKNLKRVFLKLKIKFPFNDDDYPKLNIQVLKNILEEDHKNKNPKRENLEYFIFCIFQSYQQSKAQLFQDILVDHLLKKENGFYCEVGACDGLIHSNTFFLEKIKNWKGILCEPASFWLENLKINRPNSIIESTPIFPDHKYNVNFVEKQGGRSFVDFQKKEKAINKTNTLSLTDLFVKNSVKEVDYLSIDTEGSEYEILTSLNFEKFRPKIITIEHNYNKEKRKKILYYLSKKNYRRIFKSISRFDDWYVDSYYL